MRYLLACTAMTLLALSGCDNDRQNMTVVPDRQGHAYGANDQAQPTSTGPVARADEKWYTMEPNDTLTSVAKKFDVSLEWLIKRNDIQDDKNIPPQLIVPRMQTATSQPAN